MGRGGCINGQPDTNLYASPVPLIGLYIAGVTLVCFFCMTFDLVHAFIRKKPFVPCKLFPMNSFTLTVLAVATKIPFDLTTSMPRAEDQLSKLTGTALLCTSLGFYMPSLGTMGTSERLGNMATLSVTVITMVVNVCVQMGTGVIYAFTVEHIIIMVCTLLLLLFMWSSAIAFRGQRERWGPYFRSRMSEDTESAKKGVQGLKKLLVKDHVINYTGNPQTLLCETPHHNVFGLLCGLSSAVVIEAMLRSFALKNMSRTYCSNSGVSDYGWSIPIMIVVQLLTIAVGTFSIIYRWLSFFNHTGKDNLNEYIDFFNPGLELEYLKWKTLPFRLLSNRRKLFHVFRTAKNFIMDVLMGLQIVLFRCSVSFVGIPMYSVKRILKFIIFDPFYRIFFHDQHDKDDIQKMLEEMSIEGTSQEILDCALSCVCGITFEKWIVEMGMEDMLRWRNTHKRDSPTQLIQLISNKCPASASASTSKSECFLFIRKLEAIGKEFLKGKKVTDYKYRVSCVSVLVLSGMFAELMPPPSSSSSSSSSRSSRESILQILNESFEMIYYIDQRTTDTPSVHDKTRWTAAKDVWVQWDNPHHWFRTKIISRAFKKKSKEYSELDPLHHALRDANEVRKQSVFVEGIRDGWLFVEKHEALVGTEFLIILEFLLQELQSDPDKDVFDFLEKCFAEMLYFFLSGLPRAILKEIDVDEPTEIGEERVKKAFKFFCKLEQLENTIEWSWPAEKFEPESQANDVVHSNSSLVVAAPDCIYSEVEAPNVSNAVVVDRKVGNSDVSLAVVAATCAAEEDEEDDDDDDEIKEIGSDEIV
ncbi:uncharacterized protein LOC122059909 [Macadamia integrifolia]|uniref:uncharacterized protein LOC122059909 n=1 Tax=Macadamia integrifolia TaxID=60698 RepID=UPI001C52C1C2|nr:uncharacterized protein LOC122059909 [Macadamia integrifolia]XP_042478913.1 uncharacterized protein LOC122059909 [Macadamia integrifolia]